MILYNLCFKLISAVKGGVVPFTILRSKLIDVSSCKIILNAHSRRGLLAYGINSSEIKWLAVYVHYCKFFVEVDSTALIACKDLIENSFWWLCLIFFYFCSMLRPNFGYQGFVFPEQSVAYPLISCYKKHFTESLLLQRLQIVSK